MIYFFAGLSAGLVFGVVFMALMSAASSADDEMENMIGRALKGQTK
ncbi:MAG: DUF3789 domain-containing protein [Clostridia bacterium]|nr:DUF3789 domain-containing protein [Clostridia bacterium]